MKQGRNKDNFSDIIIERPKVYNERSEDTVHAYMSRRPFKPVELTQKITIVLFSFTFFLEYFITNLPVFTQ